MSSRLGRSGDWVQSIAGGGGGKLRRISQSLKTSIREGVLELVDWGERAGFGCNKYG